MQTFIVTYENFHGIKSTVIVDASSAEEAVNAAKAGDDTFVRLIHAHGIHGKPTCSAGIGFGEDSASGTMDKKPWQSESLRPVQGAMDGVPFGRQP